MEIVQGVVRKIFFSAPEGTFCAFTIVDNNDERINITCERNAPNVGDELELKGKFIMHPKYGKQFTAVSFQKVMPDSIDGAARYLDRLEVKGLGNKSVERIIEYFGEEITHILKHEPHRLQEVPGVRQSVKTALYETVVGAGALEEISLFLEENGISSKWGPHLYELYGGSACDAVRDNPYNLLRICEGMHFSAADTLALHLGVIPNDDRRIEAGILSVLNIIGDNGNTCLPIDELIGKAYKLLGGYADEIADVLERNIEMGTLHYCEFDGLQYVYPMELYMAEGEGARKTNFLLTVSEAPVITNIDGFLQDFEKKDSIVFSEEQKKAIHISLENKLSVITGGPGTGKTTIIKALVEAFHLGSLCRVLLCAPTGRAAKRLGETTGFEATTIHRLLVPVAGGGTYDFLKNEEEPLEADVVIVDEASMLNIQLYTALLSAIPEDAYVVLVGDVDQLPPIGPGFVLRDLLDSMKVQMVRLDKIYRQQSGNQIVSNAHLINSGKMPNLNQEDEFLFRQSYSLEQLMSGLETLYKKALVNEGDPLNVQIISPMRRGAAGSVAISKWIQHHLNKKDEKGQTITINGQEFRVGDKVIQNVNNYELEIYNGEIGIIYAITESHLFVRFTDKDMRIPLEEAGGLSLAYAITVHKSQGSEYGTVIIPFLPLYGSMLQRNLLYTAVTRARNNVVLLGTSGAIEKAVKTMNTEMRYSLFKARIDGDLED